MRGDWTQKDRNKCEMAPQAPVQSIQKSEADVQLAIFFFIYQSNHTYSTDTGRSGEKAASQQVDTQKLLSSKENN